MAGAGRERREGAGCPGLIGVEPRPERICQHLADDADQDAYLSVGVQRLCEALISLTGDAVALHRLTQTP